MTTEERFAKLEDVMDRLATRGLALDDARVSMAESQERLADIPFRRTSISAHKSSSARPTTG